MYKEIRIHEAGIHKDGAAVAGQRYVPKGHVAFRGAGAGHFDGVHRVLDGVACAAPREEGVELSPYGAEGARSVATLAVAALGGDHAVEPAVDVGRGDGRDVALGEGGVVELREETHSLDGGLRRSDRFGIFDIQLSGVGKEDAFPLCFARTAGGHGMVAELFLLFHDLSPLRCSECENRANISIIPARGARFQQK